MRFPKLWQYSSIFRAALEATSGNTNFTDVTRRKSPSSEINFLSVSRHESGFCKSRFPTTAYRSRPYCTAGHLAPQPSHNPDMFQSDFHVFDEPKTFIQGRRISSDDILKSEIRMWLGNQDDFFYSLGLENFIGSYDKRFITPGYYVGQSRAGIET